MITDVRSATKAVTGYSREELVGQTSPIIFPIPLSRDRVLKGRFEVGEVRDYPLEILPRDGRVIPVLYDATVYRDSIGEVAGVFATAHNITLNGTELIDKQSPDGVLLIDPETQKPSNSTRLPAANWVTQEEFANLAISDYEVIEKPEDMQTMCRKLWRVRGRPSKPATALKMANPKHFGNDSRH